MSQAIEKPDIDWDKMDNLIPAVVQNHHTGRVLMLGYMNAEALDKTLATGKVTFFSRSKTACGPRAKNPATYCSF